MALRLAVVVSQAPGLEGTPSAGHRWTAVERWPADGVPPNPGAWLTTTANRKAIDRIRRENKRDDRQQEAQLMYWTSTRYRAG